MNMEKLKDVIGEKLVEIMELLEDIGLENMTNITFIARDKSNPELFIVMSNEDDQQDVIPLLKQ